jgi:PAS domain S-box-containing protein
MAKVLKEYGLAIAATLLSLLVRLALDPTLGDHLPYLTFFLAVAITTLYGGLGASLAAVALGGLASNWFFIAPRQSLFLFSTMQQVGYIAYFAVALSIAALGHAWRLARRRAERVTEGLRREIVERQSTEDLLNVTQATLLRAQRSAQAGLWEVELPSLNMTWSSAYYELFGLAPTATACVATWLERIHPEDRSMAEANLRQSIEHPGPHSFDFRIILPDGTVRWVQRQGNTVLDEKGRPVRLSGITLDITARKQSEAALRESEDKLRIFAGQLEQLVAERTDELFQSQGRLRALAAELNLTEQRERKRIAVDLHDHLQQIIVLGKMKLGQAKHRAKSMPVDTEVLTEVDQMLSEALKYTHTLVAELAPQVLTDFGLAPGIKWLGEWMQHHGLTVAVEVHEDTKLSLTDDLTILLFQAVRELLINVVKHAESHEAWVSLQRRNGMLCIEVKDLGKGFDGLAIGAADKMSFGLFSIRERMHALGGSLEIDSALGHGTTARLTLSLNGIQTKNQGVDAGLRPAGVNSSSPHTIVHSASEPIRVLLVEDHIMVRQGLRSILQEYPNLEIIGEASNGKEALALVDKLNPSVVVMDINMPEMNGIEATTHIKMHAPHTIVIGLSVHAGRETQEAMLQAGATHLIHKEAAVEQLYEAIQQSVNQPIG